MSASLAQKIRNSRERTVTVNGLSLLYMRPTDIQIANLHAEFEGSYNKYEVAKRFVIGWKDVKESDLYSGGSDEPARFDDEVYAEWLADARDAWPVIYEAVMTSYVDYSTEREKEVKN